MFLKIQAKPPQKNGLMQHIETQYSSWLSRLLHYRMASVLTIVGLFVFAIYSFRYIPAIFFPPSEDPTFTLEVELPIGTPIRRTEAVVANIEQYLQTLRSDDEKDGLINWNVFIGNGGPRYVLTHSANPASPNYAFFILNIRGGPIPLNS